jgi:carbonic anhydrase/acetyltransferase-like protein (isoleucine patch superfamily)
MKDVVILGGAAGMTVVYYHLREVYPEIRVAVLDERAEAETAEVCKDTLPVITDWDFDRARKFYGADGDAFRTFMPLFTFPRVKKVLVDKALEHGLRPAPTFVHPRTQIIGDIELGVGGFIGTGCDIAPEAQIGDYVSMGNAVIGHHVAVGDYCTVGTNTALLGFCQIGEGVQVSPGAIVRTGVRVAPWVIIGIQAAVVADVTKKGITVAGVPAKEIQGRGGHA